MFNNKRVKRLEERINQLEITNDKLSASVLGYKYRHEGHYRYVETLPNIRKLVDMTMEHLGLEYMEQTTNPSKLVKTKKVVAK